MRTLEKTLLTFVCLSGLVVGATGGIMMWFILGGAFGAILGVSIGAAFCSMALYVLLLVWTE